VLGFSENTKHNANIDGIMATDNSMQAIAAGLVLIWKFVFLL
jgi:hypothetical protein